jgi:DNA repair protein RecN (Recombination protein N)
MLSSAQLEILDDFCGTSQQRLLSEYAAAYHEEREQVNALASLRQTAAERERKLEFLSYELSEIELAGDDLARVDELRVEQTRLVHFDALKTAALAGVEAIARDDGEGGAMDLLSSASTELVALRSLDDELDPLIERYQALIYEAQDLASELRAYATTVEAQPARLVALEEQLAQIEHLERKYGGSATSVIAHAQHCKRRHEELQNAEVRLTQAQERLTQAQTKREQLAAKLRETRRQAAPKLAEAVRTRLQQLAMEDATFTVALEPRQQPGLQGSDLVTFTIAPNPGVPPGPLREIASGGELSRVMLALSSAAAPDPGASETMKSLLVFDEIDAGIGGRTARAVGNQLQTLAEHRQVLCITHLPQIAALADRHFQINKDTGVEPARTVVQTLKDELLVEELVRMLGADHSDEAATQHARELLRMD